MTPATAFSAYCEAFAAGDHHAMASLFDDEGVFEASSLDEPIRGKAALFSQLRIISNSCRNISTQIRVAIESGNKGFFEGSYEAEIIGTGGKIDGSPHRIDFKFVAIIEMSRGRISRLTEIFDTRPFHPEERQRVWVMNRRTPYWDATVDAKCKEWSVYNNMFFPMIYSRTPYEDYCALMEGVTLWDVALERQTQLRGPDAHRFLDYLCCRDMSKMQVGDCRYAMVCDDYGKMMGDPVVLWPWEDTIWLSHGNTDLTLWARGIVMNSDWQVEVSEPDVAPLQVQGPLSLKTLEKLCPALLAGMKNYTCLVTEVAGQAAVVSRTGWSGGFGYEVMPLSSANALELWDAILEAGKEFAIKVTGPIISRAVERGVTDTNYYMNSDLNALEDTCASLVDVNKASDFIGKAALQRIAREGVKRHSVGLLFREEVPRMEWFWTLQDRNSNPGEVRWAVYSFELGHSIGIAVVDISVEIGDVVEVTHPRGAVTAEVTSIPFVSRSS